jgi:hypothetical protein
MLQVLAVAAGFSLLSLTRLSLFRLPFLFIFAHNPNVMQQHLLLKELQSKYGFPEEEFPKLLAFFKEKHFKKNEIMFKAGDVVKHTYFI